jgi:hypothetical protein
MVKRKNSRTNRQRDKMIWQEKKMKRKIEKKKMNY